ncbi:MAG: hypothetical protein M3024_00190, partial [Candidatus Dormibacteraeota bacterium]|nr:hypothetical protein [Candidatus Dormibacteraeota bacterium]
AVTKAGRGTAQLRLTLTGATLFGSPPQTVPGSGSFSFGAGLGTLSLAPAGKAGRQPLVFVPGAVYLRPSLPASLLPPGKAWLRLDLTDPAQLARSFPQMLLQVESVNPALALDEIAWGTIAADSGGHDQIGGRTVPRYDLRLNLRQALNRADGAEAIPFRAAIAAEIAALGRPGREPTTRVRAWVADDGTVVGVQLLPPGAGAGVVTFTFGAFGAAVGMAVPPAAEVAALRAVAPFGERENQNGGDSDGG